MHAFFDAMLTPLRYQVLALYLVLLTFLVVFPITRRAILQRNQATTGRVQPASLWPLVLLATLFSSFIALALTDAVLRKTGQAVPAILVGIVFLSLQVWIGWGVVRTVRGTATGHQACACGGVPDPARDSWEIQCPLHPVGDLATPWQYLRLAFLRAWRRRLAALIALASLAGMLSGMWNTVVPVAAHGAPPSGGALSGMGIGTLLVWCVWAYAHWTMDWLNPVPAAVDAFCRLRKRYVLRDGASTYQDREAARVARRSGRERPPPLVFFGRKDPLTHALRHWHRAVRQLIRQLPDAARGDYLAGAARLDRRIALGALDNGRVPAEELRAALLVILTGRITTLPRDESSVHLVPWWNADRLVGYAVAAATVLGALFAAWPLFR